MVRVAVVGVTGYTGAELVRLIAGHPGLELTAVVGRSEAGKPLAAVYPHLATTRYGALVVQAFDAAALAASADVAFLGLPHGAAAEHAAQLLERGMRVVDLSADFRLRSEEDFRAFYGEHHAPSLQKSAVYGMPELHRNELRDARLVAAPGCYVTATVLGAAPLLALGLADLRAGILADCKSGVSGAGRTPSVGSLFAEAGEGMSPYKVDAHRHRPEIEQELRHVAGAPVRLTFVPHLVPMTRGILATIYADPTDAARDLDTAGLVERIAAHYENEPFVRVLPPGQLPSTTMVRGSNFCLIGAAVDRRAGRLIVASVIDNLVKGASGQAVQALNVVLGLPETAGLGQVPLYP
ncbi:N-acetyl-gamma-glutamyl-phosphate reductase [Vulgatibacter sp.]|uniref:N-acetyl-gamma-glutamyl-phosphate reductase n=1 Tax=Vulgatibacter sp. TaxID=1971226 RepID=UPI003566951F